MKFGVYVNPQTVASETGRELREGMLRIARTAEAAGFDQVMAGQHYLSDFTQLQLLPFLARLTGEVEDMEIATGIVLLPFHHPVEIAEQIATIDALHDGPTAFGVGAGYRDVEFEAFGVPKAERVPRLIEGLDLTERLLTEESVTHDGEFYTVEDATIPIRPPESIPIWLAANADRAVERAARIADAWLVNPHATVGEIAEQKERCYDPIRAERGEGSEVPVIREAFVAPTREEAVWVAREHLEEKYRRYVSWGQDEAMEDTEDLHRPFEELAEDRFVLGTPAEVCAELERYEEELDASHVLVRSHWPGLPYERVCESLELMGEEVLPNL
ncbi:LLM class flavin-dependent oxidoreductase [Halalkalicoccus jeotgali]|uniref:Luciferase-like monooxygenase n=1 Tax=Halalkalicoccus jeotgali (strain DSM 18796 / CECT 7217 / JCM 14584 / KCTC 4019 / B3) TaxID=795797 RepID=D8J6H0_HALJB|nr:LLM class flavin-dependent oxidoreductase [Halalkalicoccus jeotgali]ADJ13847.1 Luciferase-like monooxygenase [Halalkalicoccus jeotgali B3]ELY34107.1 Luciferase-like monooxygenase [Halalkalicoccus jeotgali B3]